MKVAVITPYYKEPLEMLQRCHASVAGQTYSCTHYLVADGFPNPRVTEWPIEHIVLPRAHGDNGNTPRGIGAISALNQGFDAFAFLDADNWFAPEHVESLVELVREMGVHIAFSGRQVVLPDGTLVTAEEPEDVKGSHADTSAFFVTKDAAFLLPYWAMMDQASSPACDRIMFRLVQHFKIPYAFTDEKTMFFESRYSLHYQLAGQPIPEKVNDIDWERLVSSQSAERSIARTRMNLLIKAPPQTGTR